MQNDLHENKAGVCIVSFVAAKLHVSELDNEHSIGMLRLEKVYHCCIACGTNPTKNSTLVSSTQSAG